jgi:hypothetical protein
MKTSWYIFLDSFVCRKTIVASCSTIVICSPSSLVFNFEPIEREWYTFDQQVTHINSSQGRLNCCLGNASKQKIDPNSSI